LTYTTLVDPCDLPKRDVNLEEHHTATISTASAAECFRDLVHHAVELGVSDLHFTPASDQSIDVQVRLDGVLQPFFRVPAAIADQMPGRVKYLAGLRTYQTRFPQDGRISAEEAPHGGDLRVSTYPTIHGEKLVVRFFHASQPSFFEDLRLPQNTISALREAVNCPSGMILITGPAGSGKTTTIYAALAELTGRGDRHIITLEDPVETQVPGVTQTEVNPAVGLDFATALRYILRQDPEVIVIGEIRDEETAAIAVRSAFTGHLVIATLHAGSCQGVLERLFDMTEDNYAAAASVQLILNQRLIRRLCPQCAGQGCADCLDSGFSGRVPLAEHVRINEQVRDHVKQDGPRAVKPDTTMQLASATLIKQGITTPEETARLFGDTQIDSE